MTNFFRAATVLLVFTLFTVSSVPAVVQAIPDSMHGAAHFSLYTLLAFIFCLGWPKMKPMYVAAIITTIGIIHELSEIVTHHHGFEFEDAIVDGAGALIGVVILVVLRRLVQ